MSGDKKTVRKSLLVKHLATQQYLSLDAIARHFNVTTQTARRDVTELEKEGRIRRIHGGAMIGHSVEAEELRGRRVRNALAKDRIAACVAEQIADDSSIFLDTGTTCEAIARTITHKRGLRIVTYSIRIAAYLSEMTDFTVAVPGGFVRQVDGGVFQDKVTAFITGFKFDLAILSVSSIDEDGDLGDDDHGEVEAVRAAIGQSRQVMLAADSSKFGQSGLVRLGSLSDVDILITDAALPAPIEAVARHAGVLVRYTRA
ncbi:DeoR/GlpR transcriptional regulator (plasmid) [Qingshengfaniella alkalisoli]|uniref:DeoR/GlpR transcriptional regulator n=2 Tax=Qingshengfaniella alkalisoli TaxID=2599296 RepID=A0A5B8J8D3_9RHOB|nr:DeoR/GlpR transcriptional regulator [Qingshengfaniella alkalisoli]